MSAIGPVRQQRSGSVSYGLSANGMDWADRQYRTGSYGLGRKRLGVAVSECMGWSRKRSSGSVQVGYGKSMNGGD